jgi:hypothetical protein
MYLVTLARLNFELLLDVCADDLLVTICCIVQLLVETHEVFQL